MKLVIFLSLSLFAASQSPESTNTSLSTAATHRLFNESVVAVNDLAQNLTRMFGLNNLTDVSDVDNSTDHVFANLTRLVTSSDLDNSTGIVSEVMVNSTDLAGNLTADDNLLHWLQENLIQEVDQIQNTTKVLMNESKTYWDEVMSTPCVQNGEVLIAAAVGFLVGAILSPIMFYCCFKMRNNSYQVQNRRRYSPTTNRKTNITDLAHLMDRDQDSEMEVL
ncbi:unnamed protein product [Bursaphelenchus okinawaensis]|uniref:Uncharacterized protein n=1 Tax=Bursaphelenchus okinawaensis TaxID=465554 RepID=A0A811LQ52_9BILA|nr:unnamed protein product [Bursaphelenchus okinawaensis]CAG9125447.1 unnamed protein product [Bursaphelenchus okinawaensis]